MVHLECPMCSAPLALEDDVSWLTCGECGIVAEFAPEPTVDLIALAA